MCLHRKIRAIFYGYLGKYHQPFVIRSLLAACLHAVLGMVFQTILSGYAYVDYLDCGFSGAGLCCMACLQGEAQNVNVDLRHGFFGVGHGS